jgi:hypothetical protein
LLEPVERSADRRRQRCVADFHQRMRGQRGVPYRRDAGLAVAALALRDEQFAQRRIGRDTVRVIPWITQAIVHYQSVGHGREDGAEPILAVETLGDEGHGPFDRAPSRVRREDRLR